MSTNVWSLVILVLLTMLGIFCYVLNRRKQKNKYWQKAEPALSAEKASYQISYVPSDKEWSGSSSGIIALKTLTYRQYECLEDARYGFNIIGVTPTQRKNVQPHKTRAHGQKTVSSLVRHGFLISNGEDTFVVTDHGLNALAVCNVRY